MTAGAILQLQAAADLAADLIDNLSDLIKRLHGHGVRSAVLLHAVAGAAAVAATCLQRLQQLAQVCQCSVIATPDSPDQHLLALRMAVDRLGLPAQQLTIVSISHQPLALSAEAAASLGCAAPLHVSLPEASSPWLQAAVLQAVASRTAAAQQAVLVGYAVKQSRALALEQQGMLPLLPVDGVCFAPLDLGRSLIEQVPCLLLLHKLTDSLEPNGGSGEVPSLNAAAQRFLQQAAQAGCCLADPWPAVQRVTDRAALGELLDRACLAVRKQAIPMRSPAWALVQAFDPVASPAALAAAGARLPAIAKPRAACGVEEAHQMALVLSPEGFSGLGVPLPAVVQEYVDHGGQVWKAYVAGEQVFFTQRKSTPDLAPLAARLASDPEAGVPAAIDFDSLRSLPTSLPWTRSAGGGGAAPAAPVPELLQRRETFEAIARVLQAELGLTLFGFDVVFDPVAGELVIIDLNYFPSFKGIPEAPAALRAALLGAYRQQKAAQEQRDQVAAPAAAAAAAALM